MSELQQAVSQSLLHPAEESSPLLVARFEISKFTIFLNVYILLVL